MSEVIVCKKCGKDLNPNQEPFFGLTVSWHIGKLVPTYNLSLCQNCHSKLILWLNEKPKSFPELDQ